MKHLWQFVAGTHHLTCDVSSSSSDFSQFGFYDNNETVIEMQEQDVSWPKNNIYNTFALGSQHVASMRKETINSKQSDKQTEK